VFCAYRVCVPDLPAMCEMGTVCCYWSLVIPATYHIFLLCLQCFDMVGRQEGDGGGGYRLVRGWSGAQPDGRYFCLC